MSPSDVPTWFQTFGSVFDAEQYPLVVPVMTFISIFLFLTGIIIHLRYGRSRRRIIEKIQSEGKPQAAEVPTVETATGDSIKDPVLRVLGAVGGRLQPEKPEDIKRRTLDFWRAGIRRSNAVAVFWGAKASLALAFAGIFLGLKPLTFPLLPAAPTLTYSLLLVSIGFYLPDFWLRRRIDRRRRRIQQDLPDALDLLVVCVEAGMSLDAAIHRVGEEMRMENRDLSDELALMNLEVRAGKSRRDAMRNLALRCNLDDVNSLVTLLIQTEKFGTSMAQALRVFSDAFRTARMQRAEEKAAKLPVKMLIPLALFIFPTMFVVVLGPAMIQIVRVLVQE